MTWELAVLWLDYGLTPREVLCAPVEVVGAVKRLLATRAEAGAAQQERLSARADDEDRRALGAMRAVLHA